MATTYYRAVDGITDGMTFYERDTVFVGTETLNAHFAETGGKQGDRVLYEKTDKKAYDAYMADRGDALVDGSPRGVVGYEPTGEDSLAESQTDDDGETVKADPQAAKPEDGDPLPPDSAEAARRAGLDVDQADGDEGGAGPTPDAAKS